MFSMFKKINKKGFIYITIFLILIMIGCVICFIVDKNIPEKTLEDETALDSASIPKVAMNFTGDLIKIENNILFIEILDFSSGSSSIEEDQPKRTIKVTVEKNIETIDCDGKFFDLSDLQIGDRLAITTEKNIEDEEEVTALKILFLYNIKSPEIKRFF